MNFVLINTKVGSLQLRRACDDDFDAVYAIMNDASAWLKSRGMNMWGWVPSEAGRKIVRDRIATNEAYLASIDERPVATFAMQWADEEMWGERGRDGEAGYIHGIAVARTAAGKGVGAALIKQGEKMVADRGRRFLRLDCMGQNEALCAYYQRLGFTRCGTKEGKGWSAALFEKIVGAL
jgi:ribosomal protein S18 acetylase RimI-like enzyme